MPTKSGYIQYNEDGTSAYLVVADTTIKDAPMLPMDKQAQSKVQIENNTTALGASATYTGASFDTMADGVNYTWLTGVAYSPQAGSIFIQESADGTNWLNTKTGNVAASTPYVIDETIRLRYVRIQYSNGATAQTEFKLYVYTTFK